MQEDYEDVQDIISLLKRTEEPVKPTASAVVSKPSETRTLIFKPWSGVAMISDSQLIPQSYQLDQQEEKQPERLKQCKQMKTSWFSDYFFRFQSGSVKLIKGLLEENGFKQACFYQQKWTLYWSCSPIKIQIYGTLEPFQKVNHFPNAFQLTRKDLMHRNISKMQIKYGPAHYNFIPKTFILPGELSLIEDDFRGKFTYIVKPHNRSQGKGISVTKFPEEIYQKLQKYSSLVVSHYIQNPMLINGYKFDLRIYVALTSIHPLKIYIYEEGLARFATEVYTAQLDSQNKKFIHLTNYSINKKNDHFQVPQDQEYFGSKWSLTALIDFLVMNLGRQQTDLLLDKIDDLVIKSVLSIQNILFSGIQNYVPYVNNCYQVYGFDVLIDSNLKPWLLEVNLSPSLNTDSPLDLRIKGNMIADVLTLVGVIPNDLRYVNSSHLRYQKQKFFSDKKIIFNEKYQFTPFDNFVIRDFEMEKERGRGWRRIYPTASNVAKYKNYFQKDRHLNALLRQYLARSVRTAKPSSMKKR